MAITEQENKIYEALVSAHDGDMALLYMFLSCRKGASLEDAAQALCRTLSQVRDAKEKLERLSLIESASEVPAPAEEAKPAQQEDVFPEYTSADISRCTREDAAFTALLQEAARVLGRPVVTSDTQKLMGMYKHLAMPAEVIMELLNYSSELCRVKYGGTRMPTARSLEKEAYEWARMELTTLEAAEEYIYEKRRVWDKIHELKGVMGITGKPLSAAEWNDLEKWLSQGFDVAAIAHAYDRTVSQTGSLKWQYLASIVRNWHEKGLHSVEDIERIEGRREPAPGAKPEAPSSSQAEKMQKFMEALKKGGAVHGV